MRPSLQPKSSIDASGPFELDGIGAPACRQTGRKTFEGAARLDGICDVLPAESTGHVHTRRQLFQQTLLVQLFKGGANDWPGSAERFCRKFHLLRNGFSWGGKLTTQNHFAAERRPVRSCARLEFTRGGSGIQGLGIQRGAVNIIAQSLKLSCRRWSHEICLPIDRYSQAVPVTPPQQRRERKAGLSRIGCVPRHWFKNATSGRGSIPTHDHRVPRCRRQARPTLSARARTILAMKGLNRLVPRLRFRGRGNMWRFGRSA